MKFIDYADLGREAWDRLVSRSEDGWLYQTSDYIELALRSGVKSLSFGMTTDTGELVAVCPLYLSRNSRYSIFSASRFLQRCISYIMRRAGTVGPWDYLIIETGFSGPVFSPTLGAKGRRKAFREVAHRIDALAREHHADEIQCRLTEIATSNAPEKRPTVNPLLGAGFYEPLTIPPRVSIVLDLRKGLEELWKGIDEDCRSEINRAPREGCTAVLDCENWVERYHAIHDVSWNRTMGHSHALEHFLQMGEFLGRNVRVFFARHGDKDVAAVLLHAHRDSVFYWGGCSLLEGQKVKANNFLLFESVKWAKQNNYKWFGIGIFETYPGLNIKEYKVGQYKAQFSSTTYPALEGKKYCSKRAIEYDSRKRKHLIATASTRKSKRTG